MTNGQIQTDTLTKIEENLDLKEPSLYKVILLNDDVTPVDFVIQALMSIFMHDLTTAEELTQKNSCRRSCYCSSIAI